MRREPTSGECKAFWDHMTEKFGAKVARKEDSFLMRAAARVLGQLGIADPDAFMSRYSTTIDGVIYTPFDPGIPQHPDWPLWQQMTVCVHELQHVLQQREVGHATFNWRYLSDGDERARIEARAYLCQIELDHWRYGKLPYSVDDVGELIGAYGCSEAEVTIGKTTLTMLAHTVLAGGVVNETSREAIRWLEEKAPGIR